MILYFLEGTVEDFYYTKRKEARRQGHGMDLDEFVKGLTVFLVQPARINDYWKQWNNIRRVNDTKNEASCLSLAA